jgi:hypothetical protein
MATYWQGYEVEQDEMGGACDTYGGEEKSVRYFGGRIWGKEATRKA